VRGPDGSSASFSKGYALVRRLTRLLLGLFYARIEVVGKERVPSSGGLIVAANHHNSIVDAMILMATFERPLRVLANAPLFRHPLIGPFLRLVGGLPVHRRQEAGDDPQKNAALFAATSAALREGGAILIFPEGRTQPEPTLQTVRTGAARLLLAAEDGAPDGFRVTLLPVGLVFDRPGTFRDGRALVWIGPPVDAGDLADAAVPARVLTDRLSAALRGQIVEAEDRHTLQLLRLAEELWREGGGAPAPSEGARVEFLQRAMRGYRALRRSAPERVEAFRGELERFAADAERAGLAAERLSRSYSAASVARFAATEGLSLLLAAPIALAGLLLHGIPYRLTAFAVTRIPHTDEEEATDKIAAGLVLYPVCWAAEGWAALALGGKTGLVLFLLAVPVTAFFALAWLERFDRVRKEAVAFGRFLGDRELPARLRERRRVLVEELRDLARRVEERPEESR
jgi:glycerol-3-phosphate O-acyltransferase / dihydroxyacetone phosphate acyltransferase